MEHNSLSEEAVSIEVLHAEHRAGDVAALQQILPLLGILHAPRHVHRAVLDGPGAGKLKPEADYMDYIWWIIYGGLYGLYGGYNML